MRNGGCLQFARGDGHRPRQAWNDKRPQSAGHREREARSDGLPGTGSRPRQARSDEQAAKKMVPDEAERAWILVTWELPCLARNEPSAYHRAPRSPGSPPKRYGLQPDTLDLGERHLAGRRYRADRHPNGKRTRMPRRVWVIERYQLHPVVVPQSMHTLHVPFCTMRELPQVGQVLPSYRRSP